MHEIKSANFGKQALCAGIYGHKARYTDPVMEIHTGRSVGTDIHALKNI